MFYLADQCPAAVRVQYHVGAAKHLDLQGGRTWDTREAGVVSPLDHTGRANRHRGGRGGQLGLGGEFGNGDDGVVRAGLCAQQPERPDLDREIPQTCGPQRRSEPEGNRTAAMLRHKAAMKKKVSEKIVDGPRFACWRSSRCFCRCSSCSSFRARTYIERMLMIEILMR